MNYAVRVKTSTGWQDLALVGPQGPTGPAGPAGPQGAAGTGINLKGQVPTVGDLPPTGNTDGDAYTIIATGDMWVWDGATNAWINAGPIQGPAGPAGPAGATGPAGPTGATGATGAAGTPGATGAQGPQGVKGDPGATGATGPTGPASTVPGPTGPAGPAGAAGVQGPAGPTGPAGADSTVPGPQGPQGVKGDTGTAGAPGSDGATGPAGPQGVKGDTGNAGATGPAGPPTYALISDTPPVGAPDNSIWLESDTGISYFRWNDGTSTQWVSMLAGTAPLDSPIFTGNPRAPTPTAGDNDTSIATTAFVQTAAAAAVTSALTAVPVDGAAWTVYACTLAITGGAGTAVAAYKKIGRVVHINVVVTCTTAGQLASMSLPFQTSNRLGLHSGFFNGREVNRTGLGWGGSVGAGATTFIMTTSAGNSAAVSVNDAIHITGFYESNS